MYSEGVTSKAGFLTVTYGKGPGDIIGKNFVSGSFFNPDELTKDCSRCKLIGLGIEGD